MLPNVCWGLGVKTQATPVGRGKFGACRGPFSGKALLLGQQGKLLRLACVLGSGLLAAALTGNPLPSRAARWGAKTQRAEGPVLV